MASVIIDLVIHHADAALGAWFGGLDPKGGVTFTSPDAGSSPKTPTMFLLLAAIREQTSKRNTETRDVRDDAGRVVARQRATRYFELDYTCNVAGPHPDAHELLGRVLQLIVDHDVIPTEHLPVDLVELDEPVEISLVAPAASIGTGSASITIRLVVPVRPTVEREIAPPAEELHLDVGPAPGRAASSSAPGTEHTPATDPVEERRWTTVRRRERITPGSTFDDEMATS